MFLPGMSGRGEFWQGVANELPRHWDKKLLDWPGLGPVPPSPSVRRFEDLVKLVVDQLGEATVLVGQSVGGVVAVNAALKAPGEVSHLVLSATSGGVGLEALGATDWRPNYQRSWPDAPDWAYDPVEDLTPKLRALSIPTLLIWATRDPISPVSVGEHL